MARRARRGARRRPRRARPGRGRCWPASAGRTGTGPPRWPSRSRPAASTPATAYVAAAAGRHRARRHPRPPRPARPLDLAERRTLERGAIVTALVLLFARTVAETEDRLGGALLGDLFDGDAPSLRPARTRPAPAGHPRPAPGRRRRRRRGAGPVRRRPRRWPGSRPSAGLAGEYKGGVVLLVPGGDPLAVGDASAAAAGRRGHGHRGRRTRHPTTWPEPTSRPAAASTRCSPSAAPAR